TLTLTAGDPVSWIGLDSGAEVKAALWPGMSKVSPAGPSGPRPGKAEMEAGAPPAGLAASWGGPGRRPPDPPGPARAGVVAAGGGQLPGVATRGAAGSVEGPKPSPGVTETPGWPGPAPAGGWPGASHRRSHCVVSDSTRAVSWLPPSWPPANHTMFTGAPL